MPETGYNPAGDEQFDAVRLQEGRRVEHNPFTWPVASYRRTTMAASLDVNGWRWKP
jgi:hypothetical protein